MNAKVVGSIAPNGRADSRHHQYIHGDSIKSKPNCLC